MTAPERERDEPVRRFSYFMVRVQHDAGARTDIIAGVVERVGSGEKREFRDAEELLRAIAAWSNAPTKMEWTTRPSNC